MSHFSVMALLIYCPEYVTGMIFFCDELWVVFWILNSDIRAMGRILDVKLYIKGVPKAKKRSSTYIGCIVLIL